MQVSGRWCKLRLSVTAGHSFGKTDFLASIITINIILTFFKALPPNESNNPTNLQKIPEFFSQKNYQTEGSICYFESNKYLHLKSTEAEEIQYQWKWSPKQSCGSWKSRLWAAVLRLFSLCRRLSFFFFNEANFFNEALHICVALLNSGTL